MPESLRVACIGHALKESLTARQCLHALVAGVRVAGFQPLAELCISDGGDGFLEAAVSARSSLQMRKAIVRAPHGVTITASYAIDPAEHQAVIESAEAVGMRRVPPAARQILELGTGGLGELLVQAWQAGAREILVGLGGSATCDGGLGMLGVLHDVFVADRPLSDVRWLVARDLADPPDFAWSALTGALRKAGVNFRLASDVESPLLGPTGAAKHFAPQKGATPVDVEWLEKHLSGWADRLAAALGRDLRDCAGAGAAGGLGLAFLSLGAELSAGALLFLRMPIFRRVFETADLIVTAEGRFDATSFGGKAPWRVAQLARSHGKAAAIICATADKDARERAYREGVAIVEFAVGVTFQESCRSAAELITHALANYLRLRP
ncbi:MAG: glycerate kinase [Candidatus Sumerlaeaceae bacterium]